MDKNQLAAQLAHQGLALLEEGKDGRPAYKSPSVVISTGSAILETVSTFFGFPGVGSAIAVLLSAIFKKQLDRMGTTRIQG